MFLDCLSCVTCCCGRCVKQSSYQWHRSSLQQAWAAPLSWKPNSSRFEQIPGVFWSRWPLHEDLHHHWSSTGASLCTFAIRAISGLFFFALLSHSGKIDSDRFIVSGFPTLLQQTPQHTGFCAKKCPSRWFLFSLNCILFSNPHFTQCWLRRNAVGCGYYHCSQAVPFVTYSNLSWYVFIFSYLEKSGFIEFSWAGYLGQFVRALISATNTVLYNAFPILLSTVFLNLVFVCHYSPPEKSWTSHQ